MVDLPVFTHNTARFSRTIHKKDLLKTLPRVESCSPLSIINLNYCLHYHRFSKGGVRGGCNCELNVFIANLIMGNDCLLKKHQQKKVYCISTRIMLQLI